ncbi:MAG: nitroreductase, partial [Dehalococcoidales bacterium]|nr:nitroreductase [Dehalococcoidales bacterium]
MELAEAIKARKSIRGFRPQPVPKPVIEAILELAARSPSWSNTQPWEVTIIGGEVMAEVKAALVQAVASGTPAAPDIPLPGFAEPYLTRRRDLGIKL